MDDWLTFPLEQEPGGWLEQVERLLGHLLREVGYEDYERRLRLWDAQYELIDLALERCGLGRRLSELESADKTQGGSL